MTWSRLTTYGHGRLRFALVIEGWPDIWVTDNTITLSDATNGARGRNVRTGLLRQGLQFSERALLAEGKLQTSGMTVSIRSPDERDLATASFARVGDAVAELGADLETADLSASIQGGWYMASGYYHIGTEVVYVSVETPGDATVTLLRARWDTQGQSFYLQDGQDLLSHQFYDYPTTAEGRRATLFAWGDGDDVTGYDPLGLSATLGHAVWRGVVTKPPQLLSDNGTWTLQLDHVYSLFKQRLCARNTELRAVGIQFPVQSPIYVAVCDYNNDPNDVAKAHFGFYESREQFLQLMSTILSDILADTTNGLSGNFSSIVMGYDQRAQTFFLKARTTGTPGDILDALFIDIRSHYTGRVTAGSADTPWQKNSTGAIAVPGGGAFGLSLEADEDYVCYFIKEPWSTAQPDHTCQSLGINVVEINDIVYELRQGASSTPDQATIDEWSQLRIFINQEWDALNSQSIIIDRETSEVYEPTTAGAHVYLESKTIEYEVVDSGFDTDVDAYWIRLGDSGGGYRPEGWVHGETLIRPTYSVVGSDIVGFVTGLIDSVEANANDGNLPFIRDVDFETASTELISAIPDVATNRTYRFVRQVSAEEVIAEELKLAGAMWSIDTANGRLTFVPMPILTANLEAAYDIDLDSIVTPHGGHGRWPGYEIQSQGIISTVTIKDGYDAFTDDHVGSVFVVRDQNVLSTHKRRGIGEITIAPRSKAAAEITIEGANDVAARLISVLGREYATVRVAVLWTMWSVQLGDVVSLTSPHVPTSDGTRGVTNKKCVVVGRRWNLDPGRAEHGELELLMLLNEPSGYCPSGIITSQTGATTTWTLTLSAANAYNILISPRNDGNVAGTFAVDDAIRIVKLGDNDAEDNGTYRVGTVTALGANTVSVTLTASWTPGADSWFLDYDQYANCEATQTAYCFVALSTGFQDTSETVVMRRFA